MSAYKKFRFEFSSAAKKQGDLALKRKELLHYLRSEMDSNGKRYAGIQLAGIKNSALNVNVEAWALIEALSEDHSIAILGTTSLVPRRPGEEKLQDIIFSAMVNVQPLKFLRIWETKSSSSLFKTQKNIAEKNMSIGGVYVYPLFAQYEGIRLFIIYPVLDFFKPTLAQKEILDWISRLSTTLFTLLPDEKTRVQEKTLQYELKTLTQHFKEVIDNGNEALPCSFDWSKTRSMVMHKLPEAVGGSSEELERELEAFLSLAFLSCRKQTVTLGALKDILDELQNESNVRAAAEIDIMLKGAVKEDYFSAHSDKFAKHIGSLDKVLFLNENDLDEEFEGFVKELAVQTLPQYKSSGYYLEQLELLGKRCFEDSHKDFKKAYAAKMQVFRDHDKAMNEKFKGIEDMLQSAWESCTLKDFVDNLPNLYSFDLSAIKVENKDFQLLPQYQLWTTKRHDYHEECVRSAVEALELLSKKLETDFGAHFMNPKVVPLPKKLNHSETKGIFNEKESIANLVRTALDKKYDRLLSVTEARKASIQDRLAKHERQLREEEMLLMEEEFGVADEQLNALTLKE